MLRCSVFPKKGSPYFHGRHWQWEAAAGKWKAVVRSTRLKDERRALEYVESLQKLAVSAAPIEARDRINLGMEFTGSLERSHVSAAIEDILKSAGRPELSSRISWQDYSERWVAGKMAKKKKGSTDSYSTHLRALNRWLPDPDIALQELNTSLLERWHRSLTEGGRKPKTANQYLKTVGQVLSRAQLEGYIDRNPAKLVEVFEEVPKDKEPFSLDELLKILEVVQDEEAWPDWLTLVLAGACTGQRLSDLTDLNRSAFRTDSAGNLSWPFRARKTSRAVHIPIMDPFLSHLKDLPAERDVLMPSMVGRKSGGKYGLSIEFRQILDLAGVHYETVAPKGRGHTWRSKTFHSLRHTCNTLLADADVPQEVRQEILGHAAGKTNVIYTHRELGKLRDAVKRGISDRFARKAGE